MGTKWQCRVYLVQAGKRVGGAHAGRTPVGLHNAATPRLTIPVAREWKALKEQGNAGGYNVVGLQGAVVRGTPNTPRARPGVYANKLGTTQHHAATSQRRYRRGLTVSAVAAAA